MTLMISERVAGLFGWSATPLKGVGAGSRLFAVSIACQARGEGQLSCKERVRGADGRNKESGG